MTKIWAQMLKDSGDKTILKLFFLEIYFIFITKVACYLGCLYLTHT